MYYRINLQHAPERKKKKKKTELHGLQLASAEREREGEFKQPANILQVIKPNQATTTTKRIRAQHILNNQVYRLAEL